MYMVKVVQYIAGFRDDMVYSIDVTNNSQHRPEVTIKE